MRYGYFKMTKKSTTNKFLEIAEKHKKSKKREKFSVVFSDYLELLEEDKKIAMLAPRDCIQSQERSY